MIGNGLEMTAMARSGGSAPLARAMHVLETVIDAGMPLSIAELAERTDIPKPTLHRLANNLVAEGLLRVEAPGNALVPGVRVTSLMCRVQAGSWTGGPLRAVIAALVADVRETCNFGVIDRDAVLYVERVECDWPIRIQLGPGSRVPLHASAIGKLLWAHLPTRARRHLMAAVPRPALTPATITDADALERQFREIRRQGYALNRAENTDGLIGLAVPVRLGGADPDSDSAPNSGDGKVVAGLSVHAPVARLDIAGALELLPRFRAAALRLGRMLQPEEWS